MPIRVTPMQAIERNGLKGWGMSVFIDREDAPIPSQDGKTESEGLASAPVTEHEQARVAHDLALGAGPSVPPLGGGPAHPFNDTGPHVFSDQEPLA